MECKPGLSPPLLVLFFEMMRDIHPLVLLKAPRFKGVETTLPQPATNDVSDIVLLANDHQPHPSGASTRINLFRPDAPALMVTADLLHLNFFAMRATNSLFALPSTGGAFNLAIQVPSVAWQSFDTRARGFTLTSRSTLFTFYLLLNAASM